MDSMTLHNMLPYDDITNVNTDFDNLTVRDLVWIF